MTTQNRSWNSRSELRFGTLVRSSGIFTGRLVTSKHVSRYKGILVQTLGVRNVAHVPRRLRIVATQSAEDICMYALGWEVGKLRDQNRELDKRDRGEGGDSQLRRISRRLA